MLSNIILVTNFIVVIVNHLISRVMLMATLVDRRPAELLIFRNYHLPSIEHESTLSPLNGFRPPARPESLFKIICIQYPINTI